MTAITSAGRWAMIAAWLLLGEPVSRGEPAGSASGGPLEAAMIGVNLAGGEFGKLPGVANRDYAYPGPQPFDDSQVKGLTAQPHGEDRCDERELTQAPPGERVSDSGEGPT
ncbi:MAG: hypothetical protein NTY19_25520 [Planctomycetota bacterium]|nr:hypothetical protein [Planctomycetota bacterium]